MGRKSASGSGIRDEQPGSYFPELRNHFFVFLGLKFINSLMRIRDLGSGMETVRIRDPGWKKVGSGIRDKHPGSATLMSRIYNTGRVPSFMLIRKKFNKNGRYQYPPV
jgi:hypothetical protein